MHMPDFKSVRNFCVVSSCGGVMMLRAGEDKLCLVFPVDLVFASSVMSSPRFFHSCGKSSFPLLVVYAFCTHVILCFL